MEEKDQSYTNKPTYTIIAHSLGTIMSLDALFYALVDQEIRTGQRTSKSPNLPFPGYYTEEDISAENKIDFTNTRWIERVQNFVTLGSPIDKYLLMWWLNYGYLLHPGNWATSIRTQINHFNYSDELDPVGHNLDIVAQTPGFKKFFKTKIDVVFNRYSVFGVAHNKYWEDNELFRAIYKNTIDRNSEEVSYEIVERFKPGKYFRLIFTTYFLTPLTLGVIAAMSFEWFALSGHPFQTKAIALVVLTCTLWLGNKVIKILVLGRQVQRIKAEGAEKGYKEKLIRKNVGWFIRLVLIFLPLALAFYAMVGFNSTTIAFFGWNKLSLLFSAKWFVAITYVCLAYHFFNFKKKLKGTRVSIEDYKSFSEDPLK